MKLARDPHPTSNTLHLLSTSFPCQTWEIVLTRKRKSCLLNVSQPRLQRPNLLQKQSVLRNSHQRLPLRRITCKMILTVLTKEEVEMMEKTEERIFKRILSQSFANCSQCEADKLLTFDHKKLERCCTKR